MPEVGARTPCIIGVAQQTWRDGVDSPEPLEMMAEVARAAATDAGAADCLTGIDRLHTIHCLSWAYDDPPRRLAERLGASPRDTPAPEMGGNVPQSLMGRISEAIARGETDLVLVVAGEALATTRNLRKIDRTPEWSHPFEGDPGLPWDNPPHPAEFGHGLFLATTTFPLFDVARRARLGIDPGAYRDRLGRLFAPMTELAAANPLAWHREAYSAEEIIEPTADNRMVADPYTKRMVAMMDVDMSAAVLLASAERADALGVPADRRVFPRGWAEASDHPHIAARPELWHSPAMEAAATAALGAAGVSVDEVEYLDLYSCFSSSILFARDALGMDDDDPRLATVTGGLPYFGGPGSGYVLHAIATMTDRLREDPGATGVVSGVGMFMAEHSYGVYAAQPGPIDPPDASAVQAEADAVGQRVIAEEPEGAGELVAYTVDYTRDGRPEKLLAVAELPDGSRCYGVSTDEQLISAVDELVGSKVDLTTDEHGTTLIRTG